MFQDDIPPPPSSNNVVIPDNWTGSASSTPAYMNATAFDSNPSTASSYQNNNYNSNNVS